MHSWLPKIGLTRRVRANLIAYAFKLSPPDVLQVLPLGSRRRRLIEVNRNLIAPPDLRSYMPRHGHTIFNRDAFNRNKRHYIRCPHPRMCSLVFGQIDQLGRLANAANGRFLDRLPLPNQRNHAAVVIGVHLAVE